MNLNPILNNDDLNVTYLKTILKPDYHDKTELKHVITIISKEKNLTIE